MALTSRLTVTTAATDRRLTSLPTAQALTAITTPEDVVALTVLLPLVSAMIENYCNRIFAQETLLETFIRWNEPRGRTARGGSEVLQLSRFPITVPSGPIVLTVTENGTALLQDTDFIANYHTGELRRIGSGGFPRHWPFGAVTVAYTAGYVLPASSGRTLPLDIENATLKLLRREWFSRSRDPMQVSHSEPGLGQTTYWIGATGGGMLPEICDLLDNYRVPVVA